MGGRSVEGGPQVCKKKFTVMYSSSTFGLCAISGNQAGFRKNYSTNDHLVRLESFIHDAFIKKEHCVAIFFDLEKAYNTTWKHGIMKDLHDIGLRGRLPNFISNFLSDRSFNIRIGSTLSDTFEQEQGVPQGSVLSPTLFNIKINNIVKCVNDTDSSLYVDDFGIFYKSKNMENIEFRLQRCLNKVETWATQNGFKFSKTKTQCVHFCQLRGLHPSQFLIFMDRLFLLLSKLSFWVFCLIRFLVGCTGFSGPLRQYFSLYRAVSQREGERGEEGKRRVKMTKPPHPHLLPAQ